MFISLNQLCPSTDDFFFLPLTNAKQKDAIVVCNPINAICEAPAILHSTRSLEEHIRFIQDNGIKEAIIIAEDIEFLIQCPSLEHLWIIPAVSARDFDYSPLYMMPNIRWLQCETVYGQNEEYVSNIDYSQIKGLEHLTVRGIAGHNQIGSITTLKTINFMQGQPCAKSLRGILPTLQLEKLSICQSSISSLEGLDGLQYIRELDLSYNRNLVTISNLFSVKESLVSLRIENCGKIKDFSVLDTLHNLESLILIGSNALPNLSFINCMPNLRKFVFRMNVIDGDLSPCLRIPYVTIQNRKHYSHKDKDFQKRALAE